MHALFIVLNQLDYLDELLLNFMEAGISGATIIDSQGMAGTIADSQGHAVAFNMLKHYLDDCKPYNKTIFTVLDNEEAVETAVETVKITLGEDAKQGAGFMFSVPIGNVYRFDDL